MGSDKKRGSKRSREGKERTGQVLVQQLIGSADALGPEGASPSTQHPAQDDPHLHLPSGHPQAPPQHSSFGTSTKPQADRALSCRPPLPPKGSVVPPKSRENRLAGKTVTLVGSMSAGRFFGGWGKLAARLRKASMKDGCCETGSVSGRAMPPKRSTQCAQPSEQGLRLESSGVSPGEEGTRCSIHPGQAHSKPQQHPVPANNTTDLIDGMEVGDVKRGASWDGGVIRSGSKSKGGRSGPLTGPVYSLLFATLGAFFGAQQLFRTMGGSELGRASNGETREMGFGTVEVATWARVSSLARSEAPDVRLHWHSQMLLHLQGFSKRSTGRC